MNAINNLKISDSSLQNIWNLNLIGTPEWRSFQRFKFTTIINAAFEITHLFLHRSNIIGPIAGTNRWWRTIRSAGAHPILNDVHNHWVNTTATTVIGWCNTAATTFRRHLSLTSGRCVPLPRHFLVVLTGRTSMMLIALFGRFDIDHFIITWHNVFHFVGNKITGWSMIIITTERWWRSMHMSLRCGVMMYGLMMSGMMLLVLMLWWWRRWGDATMRLCGGWLMKMMMCVYDWLKGWIIIELHGFRRWLIAVWFRRGRDSCNGSRCGCNSRNIALVIEENGVWAFKPW